jgi:hypothetical protein
MHRTALALFGLAFSVAACGNAGIPNPSLYPEDSIPEASSSSSAKHKTAMKPDGDLDFLDETPDTEEAAKTQSPLDKRQVGDLAVRRFTGAFTKTPLTLTEEVTARAGNLVVVDYTLEQGKQQQKLRVTHEIGTDRVLRVREMRGNKEFPSTVLAYDAMLNKTMFVPDDNEEEIGSEKATCLVGQKQLDCEKTSYRVKVGTKTATFSVAKSPGIADDVSGEISAEGKVIYRAELVEMRTGSPSGVASR